MIEFWQQQQTCSHLLSRLSLPHNRPSPFHQDEGAFESGVAFPMDTIVLHCHPCWSTRVTGAYQYCTIKNTNAQ